MICCTKNCMKSYTKSCNKTCIKSFINPRFFPPVFGPDGSARAPWDCAGTPAFFLLRYGTRWLWYSSNRSVLGRCRGLCCCGKPVGESYQTEPTNWSLLFPTPPYFYAHPPFLPFFQWCVFLLGRTTPLQLAQIPFPHLNLMLRFMSWYCSCRGNVLTLVLLTLVQSTSIRSTKIIFF